MFRWMNASEQYTVKYEFRYEPWVICDRLLVPWYDARFRGYGQNKIVHLEHMNWTGYRWVCLVTNEPRVSEFALGLQEQSGFV